MSTWRLALAVALSVALGLTGCASSNEPGTPHAKLSSVSGTVDGWDVVLTVAASMPASTTTIATVSATNSTETTLSSEPLMDVVITDASGKRVPTGQWQKFADTSEDVPPGETFSFNPDFTVPPPGRYTLSVPGMRDAIGHSVGAPFTSVAR